MSDMRFLPRYQANRLAMGLFEKIRAVDSEAGKKIASLLPATPSNPTLRERMATFLHGAENIQMLGSIFASRSFLSAKPSKRKNAEQIITLEDILSSDGQPLSNLPNTNVLDTLVLGIDSYLSINPDVAVKINLTPDERLVLTNRRTRYAQAQQPYAKLIKQEHTCNL